jgi:hypothetical protein
MENERIDPLLGMVITIEKPAELTPSLRSRVEGEVGELKPIGVKIEKVVIPGDGGPPRYHFKFPEDSPSWKVRLQIEEKHFDVGHVMGQKELSFFATRRTTETDGWAT